MSAIAHDRQIRRLLHRHLQPRLGAADLLVDELQLAYGAARADVALVNGRLEGFEIKADLDTLTRLPAQVQAYDKIFECAWVVTTRTHIGAVRDMVPRTWGLLLAHENGDEPALRQMRMARPNANRDASHLVRLLWRDEALAKLEGLGLARGLKSKPKAALFEALSRALSIDELSDYVRSCLKARTDWRVDAAPRGCGDSSHPCAMS